jgi:hypothetical protein
VGLKAFHIAFVLIAGLFSFGFGLWAMQMFMDWGDGMMLALSLASFGCFAVLIVYGFWFYRKVKGWSYL